MIDVVEVNKKYKILYKNDYEYIVCYGSAGSAKSYEVAQWILIDCLQNKTNWLVVRKVSRTLRYSCFALLNNLISKLQLQDFFTVFRGNMSIICKNGASILLEGLDDVNKIKSITGIDRVWIEEADQITVADFEELDRRPRSSLKKIILTFNPVSSLSWIKKHFVDQKIDNTLILHTTYKDNKFLPQSFIRTIENLKNTNPMAYKVYCLGEWGIADGLIFENWDVVETIPEQARFIGAGLDFGFSSHQAALVNVYECDREFYYEEVIYEVELTNIMLSELMEQRGISKDTEIIADSAEPKSITELKSYGWNIREAQKGADSVTFGIQQMQSRKQHILASSVNIIREFQTYSWAKNKNGDRLTKPIKKYDHAIDAIRYRVTIDDSIELFSVIGL
jgi:phage terminase large subunit